MYKKTHANNQKGNVMIMALALIVTFSTISMGLAEIVAMQSKQIEYMVAESKVEYIAHAGLVHCEAGIAEDVARVVKEPLTFKFEKEYCVAWTSFGGVRVCDISADPMSPCCEYSEGVCITGNRNGRCVEKNYWEATYTSRYDSLSKTISSSATINFYNKSLPDGVIYTGDDVTFTGGKEMTLSWE
jgi:hypothetical protein